MTIKQYEKELKRLDKLKENKKINRKIYRASVQELKDTLKNSINGIDYIKDIVGIEVASRKNASNGNIDWTRKTRLKNSNRSVATTI